MKKIAFLTGEDLLDVDLPIIKEIHTHFEFTWIVVLKGYGWFTEDQLRQICKGLNLTLVIFHQNFKLKNPRTLLFHIRVLLLLRKMDVDLIYDSYLGTPWMHFFSNLFVSRSKFVIAIHDVVQHFNMHFRFIRGIYANYLMKKFTNVHLFSKSQMEIFTAKYSDKKILLAPLCLKNFGPAGKDEPIKKEVGQAKFLFFGIIRANKGVDLIVAAINILIKKYPGISATIAGRSDEGYWRSYERLIEDESAFNLLIRTIDENEVPSLFVSHHCLLLPYRDVTQSGVLLTGYNYGLPAIASDLAGFREYIINGENGLLFESDCIEGLVREMERLILMDGFAYSAMRKNLDDFVKTEIRTAGIAKKYVSYFESFK